MAKTKTAAGPITLEERIDSLIHMAAGGCGYRLGVKDEAEAQIARKILAGKRGKGAKLITVEVNAK